MKTLILSLMAILASGFMTSVHVNDLAKAQELASASVYQLESGWTNQEGKKMQLSELKGGPVVAAMLYTSCPSACPLTVRDMQKIEHSLSQDLKSRVRFVIFSFDSEKDSPARLKEFAEGHQLDLSKWTLLTGSAGDVRRLAAVLGIRYKKDASGEYSHSNAITIFDREGVIRHQQLGIGASPDESLQVIRSLAK